MNYLKMLDNLISMTSYLQKLRLCQKMLYKFIKMLILI